MEDNTKNKGGVKTPEGKAISRYNAVKHGLLSKEVLINVENPADLAELNQSVYEALDPVGAIEEMLVDRIISNVWRLRRAIYVEKNSMNWYLLDSDLFVVIPESEEQTKRKKVRNVLSNDSTETILRYETTIERSLFRALHELERLQAKRSGKDTPLPAVLDINMDGPEGFVSQK